MFPYFSIFGKELSLYAIMAVIGILIGGFIFCRQISRSKLDDNEAIIFLLVIGVGMLVGGSVLYGITNIRHWHILGEAHTAGEFFDALSRLFGGSVFYGGLMGALALGILYVRLRRLPIDIYMDNAALFAPVFHAFARVGCFFGGCCYGIVTEFGLSATGNEITAIGDLPRFPVQLFESLCNVLIAVAIWLLLKKGLLRGRVFYVYLALYAFVRFFDEFLRGDEIRGFILGMSTSQFISIFVELFALLMLCLPLLRNKQKTTA